MTKTLPRRLFVSFSGGETSAFMTRWLQLNKFHEYDEVQVIFANTGQENDETLDFVERCDKAWNLGVVWLEAVVHHGKRKGCSHRVVDYRSASRIGDTIGPDPVVGPFEEVIRKYGIPNMDFPHCTRELKLNPMRSYVRSLGWKAGTYDTAIGIRCDEMDRVSPAFKRDRLYYPLVDDMPMTKPDINNFWRQQPFRLELKGYQGNCAWCWKKTNRKHATLIKERPEIYEFPERMERLYTHINPKLGLDDRVFFRKKMSTQDLRELADKGGFDLAADDADVYPESEIDGVDLDITGGCSESCEVYAL